jgi:hypothetical protein
MRFPSRLALAAGLAVLALAPSAAAVGTRTFDLDTLDELSGGDLKGVAVGSDGVVRAGFLLGDVKVPQANTVFAGLPLADGSGVLLGTSPGGKVIKLAGDQATEYADTKETAVTSLVEDARGNVYAATLPDGKIFKVSQGKAQPFATLPDTTYVWALAFDKTKTNLFAAVGLDEGRVFRINLAGHPEVYFRSDEPHIVSLAVAPNGDVLAGSSGKGLLYRISGPGRATVLYDFPGEEVKAIAAAPNGTIWAIANEYGAAPEPPKRSPNVGRTPAGPAASSARAKPGKGSLWRFDPQGRPEKMMSHSEFHYMSLALDDAGTPYVGTGAEGRVYTVDDAHVVTLVADTDERQIGALSMSGLPKNVAHPGVGAFIASSDGAVFHRILGKGGQDAVWTSKVFDMGVRARFGALTWRATGALDLSTRTGNTDTPDKTWSEWSNPIANGAAVPSPGARYVQVRARFARAPQAELEEVLLPFVTDNLRAVVTEVTAQSKSATKETKEGLAASGGEPPKHESVVHVAWKVDNPDQDMLRYRIFYRQQAVARGAWREMLRSDEIVTKTEYDWETATLPEGKYDLRVEASDEPSNPPDQVLKHSLETSGVLVDNTPPTFPVATLTGRRLRARVVDGVGPITRVDVSIDGRAEWRPLAPIDRVFDSADESFDADLSSLVPAGSHIVALRAFDAAGNYVVRELVAP